MDKYHAIKSQIFDQESEDDNQNGNLDTSMESSANANVDIFGEASLKYKGKPVQGRRYLAFTVIMIILLSIYIVLTRPSEK